jgi:hypothetical protein
MKSLRNRCRSLVFLGLLLSFTFLTLPVPSGATPVLSFIETTPGGTLFYNGSGGPAVGTAIRFDQVIGTGTPLNPGATLFCGVGGCLLNFLTGLNSLEEPPGTSYQWAGGGSFTLTGTLKDGLANIIASGTLLSGTWDSPVSGLIAGNFLGFVGLGTDVKNRSLVAYYGLPPSFNFANTEISLPVTVNSTTNGFTGPVISADLSNSTPVPEPGSLLLLGSALMGLGLGGRRLLRGKGKA